MKKRTLSFLLALLMVVSIFPAPAHATDSTDATITPTETQSPDYSEDVGKYVKLNEAIAEFTVYGLTPSTGTLDEQIFMHEDFLTDSIFQIAEWMMKDGKVWYRLTFYKGGLDNNSTFAQNFPAEPWFMQTAANELVFVDTCTVCGKPDCSGHTWCDICEEYDCGKDHTQPPVEPENPCACCDSCTGAEDCECLCGNCEFCEKTEEPTVPSISATVNGQTVTVSGEALPEGIAINIDATVIKTGAVNVTDYDISFSVDGEAYEPEANTKVTITGLDVTAESFVKVIHYLEDIEEIQKGYNAGTIQVWTDATISAQYPAAAAAAYEALGMADTVCVELFYSTEGKIFVGNGSISFNANSFSIYTVTYTGTDAGRAYAVYDDNNGTAQNSNGYSETHEITMDDSNGQTFMLTRGQKFYLDIGPTFFKTGMTSYQWYLSESSIGSMDTSGFGTLAGNDTVLTVSTNAPLYKHYTITLVGYNLWGNEKDRRYINVYVVPEVQLIFYPNIPSGATSSNVTMPSSRKTVLGDGSTAVKYTRVQVSNPSGTVTGYTFDGWYTAATGGEKVSSGSYIFLDNDNAELVSGGYSDQYQEKLYAHWKANNYTVKFHANGGTGSMDDQAMTYGKAAALNENLFTPKPGYVFAGWSTSATGSVNYSDKQSVSNLASTQDAVVNLYAVWVNTMAFEDVRIGLNESYWFTNFMYTVTADGVASSSYHAFPAEPAKQAIRHTRASKDANGNWVISADDILPGTASAYIDPSIVYSHLFRYSVVASDTTRGVADPTGADVKAFLKFTEADYTAMIKVWLQSMADRTADEPNDDGTYNVENRGATYKTDVNWNEEVDNWEEYEVIPYVIKMENYNCWRIDMIIAPMRYLTLSYDLNINTEIGYSLTGGSSIPNTQYERDTTQDVLASPHAYNSNIEVSKTVNGVKYTAQFLYWEDEQGNKYGTGYNSTVLMDGHKNLKAIWKYPDQTMGSLRVEKDVTVPVNTGLTPNTTQAFTITVKLGTSGSYPYTKYSSTGIVTETSSFTGTTRNFTLKADEYVIITGINQGITYTVSETAPTGYTNKSGTITGTIQAGNTMSATIVNENSSYTESFDFNGGSNTNTSVTVVYGSTNYFDVSWLKPTRTGHKFLGWFTAKEGGTQVYTDEGICIDGAYWSSKKWIGTANLPLYAQWEEETYTVTFVDDDGTTILSEAEYAYGTPAASIVKPADPSKAATAEYTYTFAGWTPEVVAVTGEATYRATFTPIKRSYTITWLNDDDSVIDTTSVVYGEIPTHTDPTKAATAEYTYTFAGWSPEVVAVTGEATYKATYTAEKNKYTITWINEDGTVLDTDTVAYGVTPSYDGEEPTKAPDNQYTYTFRAWSPEIVPVTGDTTYTATYSQTKNKCTVTGIIDHGGEVTNTPQSVAYGEANQAMVFTPAPGYEISGVTVNGETVATFKPGSYSFCQTITKDITVEVTTSCVVYTITYDLQGGVLDTQKTNPKNYTVETETFTLNNPTKSGYKFLGWATSQNADTGNEAVTIEKGTTGNKTFYAIWERSLVDLTITTTSADQEQSYIFTVSGTPSDSSYGTITLDVVLVGTDSITIKDLPVGEYTVTEKDGWSWRENSVESKTADLRTTSQIVSFDFGIVDDLHWLSGYSYKRKKGGS